MNMKKFAMAFIGSFILMAVLGITWHLKIFGSQYEAMNFITRDQPIFILGLLAGLLLAFVFVFLYQFARQKKTITEGITFGILLLTIPQLTRAMLTAAEHDVVNIPLWLGLEGALFLIIGVVAGALTGWIYKEK